MEMTLTQAVQNRRSIRKFDSSRSVNTEQVSQLVAFALEAPTWKNSQTGRYYAAISAEAKEKVSACLPEFNRNSCAGASALIVSTFKSHRSGFERNGEPTNELADGWGCYDLGMQNMLMLLKATEMGMDTLVMGIRDAEMLRQVLEIPEDETVVAVIALGYRIDEALRPKRKAADEVLRCL